MFCGKCGAENADGVRFCVQCGADLTKQTPRADGPVETRDPGRTLSPGEVHPGTVFGNEVRPGAVLGGRYEVLELLGAGGMGEVWKARDAELGIIVVVKVLPAALARNRRSVEDLKREAALSLRLTHPNICRLYNFHSEGDLKFLVMEYIEGRTLEEVLDSKQDRKLTLDALLPIARQVAEALDVAHSQQPPILHRDIKPANIMVTSSGQAKVLDFGLARELKDSFARVTGRETSGTLLYMSPEQFSGRPPNPASDFYSLAATLYECLAGHPPFYQGSIGHQLQEVTPTAIPGLPAQVNEALLAGLAKEPSERPATAQDLVERCGAAVRPAPGSVWACTRPRVRRRALWAALLLFALGISVGLWALIRPGGSSEPAPPVAPGWPFDAAEAKRRQQAAADALGVKVEQEVNLGNGVKMTFVLIPAGEFLMGSPPTTSSEQTAGVYGATDLGATSTVALPESEFPQHQVKLSKPFWLGKFEVTQEQWAAVNPSRDQSRPQHAVCQVHWHHCREFAQKLSARTGKVFRLPTEAEWEYACRAGSKTRFSFGDSDNASAEYAWYSGNSAGTRQPVGQKKPNAWGLYDMHGNVWEWCADWYGAYEAGPVTDPTGPPSGTGRVRRGGCWSSGPGECRCACRQGSGAASFTLTIGFRIVLEAERRASSALERPFDATEAKRRQRVAAAVSLFALAPRPS
jgi:formylglycine-generating enzyme required for sulfatase activity/predicted Ser/Thr protein kinase